MLTRAEPKRAPTRIVASANWFRTTIIAMALAVCLASASLAQQTTVAQPTLPPPTLPPPTPYTDADMVRRLTPSVVNIRVVAPVAPDGGAATAEVAAASQLRAMVGSGFVVDPSGLIVTNEHVIHGATEITVTFSDGESVSARPIEAIRMLDLAVLQVDSDRPHPAVRWGDSTKVEPGDYVFAFGNPLAVGLSVTAGIVSAVNRDIMSTPYDHFIQTDAVINHGNSGGPLFNSIGEVVGVDTAIISPTSGYAGLGFAIPAETARFVLERVRQYGWLRPGWIGIQATTVNADMAEALGMKHAEGMMVGEVAANGPAATAGLRVGDVVRRFGTLAPTDDRALQRAILAAPIGDTVPVELWRAGEALTVPVVIAEWPRQDYDIRNGQPAGRARQAVRPDLGLTLSAATDATRARHELAPGQSGVVVVGVMAGTDAWSRGISAGDVIERVQAADVATPADVQREIDKARSQNRKFALFLVRQKGLRDSGPRWLALRVGNDTAGVAPTAAK